MTQKKELWKLIINFVKYPRKNNWQERSQSNKVLANTNIEYIFFESYEGAVSFLNEFILYEAEKNYGHIIPTYQIKNKSTNKLEPEIINYVEYRTDGNEYDFEIIASIIPTYIQSISENLFFDKTSITEKIKSYFIKENNLVNTI